MQTKKCTKCCEEKLLSEFHKSKAHKDGLSSQCKVCCAERGKQYREKNKEKIAERRKQYYEKNKDKIAEQKKQYCKKNKDKKADYDKQYYEKNKDKKKQYREKNKDKRKQYYEKNKDKIAVQINQYYEKNKDKIAEQHQQYYEKNKDKIAEYQKQYCEKNKDEIAAWKKQYRKKNKDKIADYNKQYRASLPAAVYEIRNINDGKVYIGCSTMLKARWIKHRSTLRRNKHDNKYLQEDYNTFGSGSFEYNIIEEFPKDTPFKVLEKKETQLILEQQRKGVDLYNISVRIEALANLILEVP